MAPLVFLVNLAATWFMVGLIWFVQIVHYPLMADVGRDGFAAYEAKHSAWTTWVVMPAMLLELATAITLLVIRPATMPLWLAWLGVALVAVVWLSTGLLQVPQHNRLLVTFDVDAHAWLVASNWLRTAAWSVRGVLLMIPLWLLLAKEMP
jgi:uncharacterized membrane protein